MADIFDATLKRTIRFGILVLVLMVIIGLAAVAKLVDSTAAIDAIIGLLAAYGVYSEVSYSKRFMRVITEARPAMGRYRRFLTNMVVSIVVLLVLMVIFALVPVATAWIALQLDVSIAALSITTLDTIYGAMIAGMMFYWFEPPEDDKQKRKRR